jgi:SecD/SecF fusion protein
LFSAVVVVVSIVSLATNKLDQGVDFVGGRTFQVRFEKPVEAGLVKESLLKCLVVLRLKYLVMTIS